jgi:hypothetical protein
MDAELEVSDIRSFKKCLDQLWKCAELAKLAKLDQLCLLKIDLESVLEDRNQLTHSIWHWSEIAPDRVTTQNFPDYHEGKWSFIKGDGARLTPRPLEEWTLTELGQFRDRLRALYHRLVKLFQG